MQGSIRNGRQVASVKITTHYEKQVDSQDRWTDLMEVTRVSVQQIWLDHQLVVVVHVTNFQYKMLN